MWFYVPNAPFCQILYHIIIARSKVLKTYQLHCVPVAYRRQWHQVYPSDHHTLCSRIHCCSTPHDLPGLKLHLLIWQLALQCTSLLWKNINNYLYNYKFILTDRGASSVYQHLGCDCSYSLGLTEKNSLKAFLQFQCIQDLLAIYDQFLHQMR